MPVSRYVSPTICFVLALVGAVLVLAWSWAVPHASTTTTGAHGYDDREVPANLDEVHVSRADRPVDRSAAEPAARQSRGYGRLRVTYAHERVSAGQVRGS